MIHLGDLYLDIAAGLRTIIPIGMAAWIGHIYGHRKGYRAALEDVRRLGETSAPWAPERRQRDKLRIVVDDEDLAMAMASGDLGPMRGKFMAWHHRHRHQPVNHRWRCELCDSPPYRLNLGNGLQGLYPAHEPSCLIARTYEESLSWT